MAMNEMYAETPALGLMASDSRPSIRERAQSSAQQARKSAAEAEELLKLLDEHPEIERALTLLQTLRY